MLYKIAMCADQSGGLKSWLWLSETISDPILAEQQLNHYAERYSMNAIDYAEGDTEEALAVWLLSKNAALREGEAPKKGASRKGATFDAAREKMEIGKGGDNKETYLYTSPVSWREQEAWMHMSKQHDAGELES